MHADHPTNPLTGAAARLDAAADAVDRLIASADPETSYAAATAALHVHAAQAELPAAAVTALSAASVPNIAADARQAADALAAVTTLLGEQLATLSARQHTAATRMLLHLSEARHALTEAVSP